MTIYDLDNKELSLLALISAEMLTKDLSKSELLILIAFVSTLSNNLSLILAKDIRFNST